VKTFSSYPAKILFHFSPETSSGRTLSGGSGVEMEVVFLFYGGTRPGLEEFKYVKD